MNQISNRNIIEVIELYGVKPKTFWPVIKGYRNESHPLVLFDDTVLNFVIYKNERGILAKIKAANKVAGLLAQTGLPVRRLFDKRIIILRSAEAIRYGALYNFLPGETIPWEAYSMKHLKLLGKMMSDMHAAVKGAVVELPSVSDEYRRLCRQMNSYFYQLGVQRALREKLKLKIDPELTRQFERLLELCGRLANQQPLHMDFVRGNILFTRDARQISGVLDFEKTALGHPVFDVARTLAFLLVDCKYKTETQIWKYFLSSGYNKYGSAEFHKPLIRQPDRMFDVLENLIDMFLLYDMYKFLRHNPYEFLEQNEHFSRNRDLLVKRGVIGIVRV